MSLLPSLDCNSRTLAKWWRYITGSTLMHCTGPLSLLQAGCCCDLQSTEVVSVSIYVCNSHEVDRSPGHFQCINHIQIVLDEQHEQTWCWDGTGGSRSDGFPTFRAKARLAALICSQPKIGDCLLTAAQHWQEGNNNSIPHDNISMHKTAGTQPQCI